MRRLHGLFDQQQLDTISNAPQFMGTRHPTWFPLFYERPRVIDHLVHSAVQNISRQNDGERWLRDKTTQLLDLEDINNASSSLAELRTYGGLLDAGFSVTPVPRRDYSTPDFNIDAGDGPITVEVFAKHQDKEQDKLLDAVHSKDGVLPDGIERSIRAAGNVTITTTIVELTPSRKARSNQAIR